MLNLRTIGKKFSAELTFSRTFCTPNYVYGIIFSDSALRDRNNFNESDLLGIGLGIPNLNPGVQAGGIAEALAESEKADIETRMLLDKAQHTDYQATDQALLATVAR